MGWFGNKQTIDTVQTPKVLLGNVAKEVAEIVIGAKLNDETLVKISRQLDFWCSEGLADDELVALTKRLVNITAVSDPDQETSSGFRCPKVRFGKTEIQIPVVTTGGMRIQWTWLPDIKPINLFHPSEKKLLKSSSQEILKNIIRRCVKQGFIHFETARFYGTSEFQFAVALKELMDAGEFKREDFIFQTKIPAFSSKKDFLTRWNESWGHVGDRLGYIDLFAFHCTSGPNVFKFIFDNGEDTLIDVAKQFKSEGKIKNIGFSSHGSGETITKLIDTEQFDYCNLHCHFFGSYHAEGTINPHGGQGNIASVKRALELDMGVFNISPIDKGGYLQCPSAAVARTIGSKISPITFALMTDWKTFGFHTASVGFGRPTDVDEAAEAASLFNDKETLLEVEAASKKLKALAKDKLGEEWYEKGLLDIPSFYKKETGGIAIGHILWLHNVVSAYGLYDFAKQRYSSLESQRSSAWSAKRTNEENIEKMEDTNPGFSFDPNFDLTEALSKHHNPKLAMEKLAEAHSWLSKESPTLTEEELKSRGWNKAYDLQTWNIFPGTDISLKDVALQNISGGRMGNLRVSNTGPKTSEWSSIAVQTRFAYENALNA